MRDKKEKEAKGSKCFYVHEKYGVACDQQSCRQWIDYKDDMNCAIICANKNGPLTLQETSARLGVSFVRVKQNQDAAMVKLSRRLKKDFDETFGG